LIPNIQIITIIVENNCCVQQAGHSFCPIEKNLEYGEQFHAGVVAKKRIIEEYFEQKTLVTLLKMTDIFSSDLDVSDWKVDEVLKWCMFYGFQEQTVLDRVKKYNVCGNDFLDSESITWNDLRIMDPLGRAMFEVRVEELKVRHFVEQERKKVIIVVVENNNTTKKNTFPDTPNKSRPEDNGLPANDSRISLEILPSENKLNRKMLCNDRVNFLARKRYATRKARVLKRALM
jgi:hypothetical protein